MTEPATINPLELPKVGFTDPASGKTAVKKSRANQAIVIISYDHLTRIYVLYSWRGRLPTSRYIEKILSTCSTYSENLKVFGIEANAMQSLFADSVIDKSREKSQNLPLVPVNQPTRIDKNFRIATAIEPVLNAGRLIFVSPPSHTELESELRAFPIGQHKDLVDCLASAISLIPPRPQPVQQSSEAEALAEYLRQTGAPGWYIQKAYLEALEGKTQHDRANR